MKKYSEMTQYHKETLTALYASLDFMKCSDLPCEQVEKAINDIEGQYEE
jgi:hypothetical protein